ncbi:MAG: Flp pilus assembly protein TadG [Janthinobacterium sp.]|jgi:Flp pilus assembly protein TadG
MVVELALFTALLLPLTFGITEYGRAIYQYNTIAKGVRSGVRHLSQYEPGNSNRIDEAKCLTVFGKMNCNEHDKALVDGLTKNMVVVEDSISDAATYKLQPTGRGALNLVQVAVTGYRFTSLASGYVPNLNFGNISATMVQLP